MSYWKYRQSTQKSTSTMDKASIIKFCMTEFLQSNKVIKTNELLNGRLHSFSQVNWELEARNMEQSVRIDALRSILDAVFAIGDHAWQTEAGYQAAVVCREYGTTLEALLGDDDESEMDLDEPEIIDLTED